MIKTLNYRLLGLLAALFLFSGCIIVINQATPEEKELVKIQEQTSQQVAEASQKVATGNYQSQQEVTDYIAKAEQGIQDGLDKINSLHLPERAKQAAEATKNYLLQAQQIFEQIKALLSDINKLKQQSAEFTASAKAEIEKQIQNLSASIQSFRNSLDQLLSKLNQTKNQILISFNPPKT
jgi:Na+/phosphate symporter